MCHKSCLDFVANNLAYDEVQGKDVIEVGSFDINGSPRSIIMRYMPKSYLGVDIQSGNGVDLVCNAEDLMTHFNKSSFDVVVTTELLEHVLHWQNVISNLKQICKPGGIIIITTRSKGFIFHSYPYDYWRYEVEDMISIFADCRIIKAEPDPESIGVFVKVQKPEDFDEKDLSDYKIFNIVCKRRINKFDYSFFNRINILLFLLKLKMKYFFLKLAGIFKISQR